MKKLNLWCKSLVSAAVVLCTCMSYGQRIQQDIFNDLVYKSDQYEAKLKKNIFDDLTFSDSNNNKITFNKAYLEKKMGPNYNEVEVKSMFFQDLVQDYMQISGYEAAYKVDILDTMTMTDNQGKKQTAKEDIFGLMQIKSESPNKIANIQTDFSGDLVYKASNNQSASLKKDSWGNRTYTDSNKTKIEMPEAVWQRLSKRYQSENHAFIFLIEQFLVSGK